MKTLKQLLNEHLENQAKIKADPQNRFADEDKVIERDNR
jgi:hypothetical protein